MSSDSKNLTVGCLPIYSPRLPDRLGTDKVSGAGWREYRADELVWAGLKVRLSFYGRSAFRQMAGPTALRATHSPTTSQADDMSTGQLFGCANHHEQERHDELISMMC